MAEPPWINALDTALEAHKALPRARHAQLATIQADGRPANRTVVIRGWLDPCRFLITTDARSDKVGELLAQPWAELCWYFTETREQFRLAGRVTLVGPEVDGELDEARSRTWAQLPEASQRTFAAPAPGAPRADDAAFVVETPSSPPECFRLLVLDVESVDHLDLRPEPHRRTRFQRGAGGWSTEPVNP